MKTPSLPTLLTALVLGFLTVSYNPGAEAARADFNARALVKSNAWSRNVTSYREQFARQIRELEAQLSNPPPEGNLDEVKARIKAFQDHSRIIGAEGDAFRENMRTSALKWEAQNWKHYKFPASPPEFSDSGCCGDNWFLELPSPPPR